MSTFECSTCGKSFTKHPSAMKRNKSGAVYCSRKCSNRRQQRTLPDLTCPQCGKTFYRKPSERILNNNYCSRTCANQAQSRAIEKIPELRTGKGILIQCKHCGNPFHVKPHRAKKAKYCSMACFQAQRFGEPIKINHPRNMDGPNNPNYKGSNNLPTARATYFKHFPAHCMICGWDTIVDIHHIVPRRRKGNNSLDNLIGLCPNHHRMADLGMIKPEDLSAIIHAAIAELSDRPLLFDQQSLPQRENVQLTLLSVESESANPPD